MIRIMHVVRSLDYGGAEKVVVNLTNKLQGKGLDFLVCALDSLGPLKEELGINRKVECVNRKEGLDFLLPFRLAKIMKSYSPAIVHMHNSISVLYGTIAARLAGVPRIISTQHGAVSRDTKKMQLALKGLLGSLDDNIAVSADVAEDLQKFYRLKQEKVQTIINGIDDTIYKYNPARGAEERKRFGLEGKTVIGHVARLSAEKDQKSLLRAFSKVAGVIGDARLVMVGDGPLRKDLESLTADLNISDRVIFTGSQSAIPALLNMFDLFVLSSVREGTSLTLIEAMAAGLPIVATDVGGNPAVVVDKVTGLLVPAQDPGKLSEAIIYLCRNPQARQEMGRAGRKRVEENFSLGMMAEKYAQIYTELANR